MSSTGYVAFWIQPVALCEADAARYLGITQRKMAGLRVSGVAKKNAIGSYNVEDLAALVRPARSSAPPGWKNPLDDTAAEAKARRRRTY